MFTVRNIRLTATALAASAALLAGGAVVTVGAGATTTPHLVVKPATGLKNGSMVKVSGTGFTPKDTVYVVQCIWKTKGQAGCKITNATPVTITASGVLAVTRFKVTTGKIGNGKCGTRATNLKNCEMSAGNISGGDSAVARIQFVMPKG
jgi:hypothetical protein